MLPDEHSDRDVARNRSVEVGVRRDALRDSVLEQLPATSRRRARWPVRRFTAMKNTFVRIGIAAAAVVALVLVGLQVPASR